MRQEREAIGSAELTEWTVADLKPGDILFTEQRGEMVHAAIYAPEKDSPLCLIHAVNSPGSQLTKLMRTSLTSANYRVFRGNDPEANELAANIAKQWARYQVPYDEKRLQAGERRGSSLARQTTIEKNCEVTLAAAQREFNQSGRYRAVKYAARRMTATNLPEPYGRGRGVWCGMFVLMCHQTAKLAKANVVEPVCGGQATPWVSDKYTSTKEMPEKFPEKPKSFNPKMLILHAQRKKAWPEYVANYEKYREKLGSREEFSGYKHHPEHKQVSEDHAVYAPSLAAWDYQTNGPIDTFNFEATLTKGLMLEQKTADPDTFAYSLQQDAQHWREAKLNVPKPQKAYTQEEKDLYRDALEEDKKEAFKMRNEQIQYLQGKIEKLPTYDADMKTEQKIKSSFN